MLGLGMFILVGLDFFIPHVMVGEGGRLTILTGENILQDWATIVDCGDAPLTWLDNNVAFKQLDKSHLVVSGREASNTSVSKTPRILTLGGDHATTLSALRSTYQRWGPVSVIHFDSHIGKPALPLSIVLD